MLIPIVCPKCATGYQVQDALAGKAMRCPLATCRHVFLVEEHRPAQRSGSVGDLVPLVPIEDERPPESSHVGELLTLLPSAEEMEPAPAPSWASAPPPVRAVPFGTEAPPVRGAGADSAPPPVRAVPFAAEVAPPVRALPFGAEAPPVRTKADPEPRKKAAALPEPLPAEEEPAPAPPRTRMAKWVILPLLLLTVVGLGYGAWLVYTRLNLGEDKLRAEADANYAKGLSSARLYEQLAKKWPDSDHADHYRFRAEMAGIRDRVAGDDPEVDPLLDNIEQMTKDHKGKPILGEHAHDLGEALSKLMEGYGARAAKDPENAAGPKAFERAATVAKAIGTIKFGKSKPPDLARVEAARAGMEAAIRLAQARKKLLDDLRALVGEPGYRALVLAETLLREEGAKIPGVADSPEALAQLAAIRAGHLSSARYERGPGVPAGPMPRLEDEPALLPDSLVQGTPGAPPHGDGLVLALARGVLYGQSAATGRVRWAMRVGIDTAALPVRVPAGVGSRERILVLSSDTAALSALDANGDTLWRYRLGSPVLGRPLVVGQRAYLGTYGGEVHEIELAEGKCLGRFRLGQSLSLGGVLEPGSGRIYFAADEGCVYVLRTGTDPGCEAILYTRHPTGSLRGEPLLVPPDGPDGKGWLILTQAAGLRGVEMKPFALPLTSDASPVTLSPKAELEGWTWFPAYHDAEKLVTLTDAGVLGMFGLKQKGLRDQALVPLLPDGGLRLASLDGNGGASPARAAVMQVQGDDLWLLGRGRMQRLRQVWNPAQGPQLVPAWREPPELGSPLHRGQAFADAAGRGRLVAVTMPTGRSSVWSSCVDDESGRVLWKRQLGLLCQGEPAALDVGGGDPVRLAQDQGGALVALDPQALAARPGAQWVPARLSPLAGTLAENPRLAPTVLLADAGKSAYVATCPGGGKQLVVRHVAPNNKGRELAAQEGAADLGDTLAGPPVLLGKRLLLPLADGTLARVEAPLPAKGAAPEVGFDWRLPRLGRETPGFVVALDGDRFVTTNGARGLTTWEWDARGWKRLPLGGDGPTLELPDRIVSAPVRVPGAALRLAVADAAGGVSLVEAAGDGALKVVRRYDLGGAVTAGPFVRSAQQGPRLGVIVDQSRLVWIDPAKAAPSWSWPETKGEPIVGLPVLADGFVLVADQSGAYAALAEDTGKASGKGHRLSGSISPAASPVPFGKDRLLAPLSDGTLLLLDLAKLTR